MDKTLTPNSQSTPQDSYLDLSEDLSATNQALESTISEQEELYGEVKPAPKKLNEPKALPKLSKKLMIPKRRSTTTPRRVSEQHIIGKGNRRIPMKSTRNFSSPLPRKVLELGTSPIPDLSPKGSVRGKKAKYGGLENLTASTPISLRARYGSAQSPLAVRSFSSPAADIRMSGKIPIQVQLNQLSKSTFVEENERQLEREIQRYEQSIEKLKSIEKERSKDAKGDDLDGLIAKWRDAAKAASNYVLNDAKLKIDRMGGIEEYRKKQQGSRLRQLRFQYDTTALSELDDFMRSPKYKSLGKVEKEEVEDRKRAIEKMGEKIEHGELPGGNSGGDLEKEFSMRELYGQLNLDYNLVYRK